MGKCLIETLASLRYGTEWDNNAEFRGFGTTSIPFGELYGFYVGGSMAHFLSILPHGNESRWGENLKQTITRVAHYHRSNVIQDGSFVKNFVEFAQIVLVLCLLD